MIRQANNQLSSTVANRSEDEGVGLEDLDVLQAEIETLLVSVTRRQISVQNELDTLVSWNENQSRPSKQQDKSSNTTKASPTKSSGESSSMAHIPGKRKSIPAKDYDPSDHQQRVKKLKDSSSSSISSSVSTLSSASCSIKGQSALKKSTKSKNLPVSSFLFVALYNFCHPIKHSE